VVEGHVFDVGVEAAYALHALADCAVEAFHFATSYDSSSMNVSSHPS
jgi:hypothetical protein